MTEHAQRRVAGLCGLSVGVLDIVVVWLYFTYDGPPPAWDVLTRTVFSVVMVTALLVFIAAVVNLIRASRKGGEGLASIAYGAGVAYVAVTLVSASLEAGVPLYTPSGVLDPTIDGPLAAGMVLIHGPVARVLTIVLLVCLGRAASRTGVLPRWAVVSGYIIAVANLAFIPSIYFGMNPAHFYAANGWGSTATISSVLLLWTAAVGVAMLRGGRPATAVADRPEYAAAS